MLAVQPKDIERIAIKFLARLDLPRDLHLLHHRSPAWQEGPLNLGRGLELGSHSLVGLPQRLLCALPFTHIPNQRDHAGSTVDIEQRGGDLGRQFLFGLGHTGQLVGPADALREHVPRKGLDLGHFVRVDSRHRHREEFLTRVSQHVAGLRVDLDDCVAVRVDDKDPIIRVLKDRSKGLLASAESLCGLTPLLLRSLEFNHPRAQLLQLTVGPGVGRFVIVFHAST